MVDRPFAWLARTSWFLKVVQAFRPASYYRPSPSRLGLTLLHGESDVSASLDGVSNELRRTRRSLGEGGSAITSRRPPHGFALQYRQPNCGGGQWVRYALGPVPSDPTPRQRPTSRLAGSVHRNRSTPYVRPSRAVNSEPCTISPVLLGYQTQVEQRLLEDAGIVGSRRV